MNEAAVVAGIDAPATAPTHGPATQALVDAQNARRIALADAPVDSTKVNAGGEFDALPTKAPGRRRSPATPTPVSEVSEKKPRTPAAKADMP